MIETVKCGICGKKIELDFAVYDAECSFCCLDHYDIKQIIKERNQMIQEQKNRIVTLESLFADPYFKGLKPAEVIELAKKSIRLTKDNCELLDQVEALERQVEDLREDLTMAVCGKEDREDN